MKHIDLFGPLKCLMLRENPQTQMDFDHLMSLESHLNERRGSDVWLEYNKTIVQPFLNTGTAEFFTQCPPIDETLLQTICGILDVNSFEIRAPDSNSIRAIYLKASLLAHQCIANTSIAIDYNHQMKIYANVDIKEGDMLHYCYTNPLLVS